MNDISAPNRLLGALADIGAMAASHRALSELEEHLDALEKERGESGAAHPFFILRDMLSMTVPQALCVALWLNSARNPDSSFTPGILAEEYKRLGGDDPEKLSGLFISAEGRAALHPILADFLLEREPRLPGGARLRAEKPQPLYHGEDLLRELGSLMQSLMEGADPEPTAIALCGEVGSGRKFLFSRLADGLGFSLLTVRDDDLTPVQRDDLYMAALIYGAFLCLEGQAARNSDLVSESARRMGIVFLLLPTHEVPEPDGDCLIFQRDVPPLTGRERLKAMKMAFDGMLPADIQDLEQYAGLYRLTPGQIQRLRMLLRAEQAALGGKPVASASFRRLLRQVTSAALLTGTKRMESEKTLKDLVLPPLQKKQLEDICGFAKMWERVYRDWNFRSKTPYGAGMSVLFYGSPGTGKTMAATVLANEVGLELFRVDLSQMISKYIGETQKNIGKIFDEAVRGDCILFFDEADALFARRSEGSDSQDRYSNAEIAYLLQRTEQHDGICILATNLLQNFDEAFRRRISYMLHFPLPDAALREQIWRGIFPEEAPLDDIDYQFLARHLELSGASIKNCAIHSAYLAALRNTAITMEYILEAARGEYGKQGKTMGFQAAQFIKS